MFKKRKEEGAQQNKPGRYYDYSLLFVIIFLSLFGLLMIYSASSYVAALRYNDPTRFVSRQAMVLAGGFVAMLVISKIDYRIYSKFAALAYIAALGMMILVNYTPLGIERNGKKRWLGVGETLSFQPTEFVKIALIVVLASLITLYIKKIDQWKVTGLLCLLSLPLVYLVADNNLSSGIIILGIVAVMIFVASRKKKRFFVVAGIGILLVFLFVQYGEKLVDWNILEGYQLNRIRVWKNPEAYASDQGYQVLQGLYAIGSGGLFGKGLGASIQKLGFVPEAQNDMIFSIICEELGLFGACCVILLFVFMLWRFMIIASNAPDLFGSLLVVGVMAHIAIQVILNIAVVSNTIPNTGITLPFISYGGTSMLFLMAEMGMVLGVSNQIRIRK